MGVPKFFRYISERYPCLSEVVKEYQIPEFDHLYLDMNGIIHMCSHPDDNNPLFRITEEKIFQDIFHYIEVLFRMIRPQKLFFMAIDGVAPRAKMNQQRGRRFRSAKDAAKQEDDAKKKGEKLPETARFDSNCITPGTVFMARLHEQLKYFVVDKISNDPIWRKCKIILSGHETPGEGEHKIMDYIRYMRAQPGYDPNTRHCLYGLDADLIMLGLCTHEPHFSLLREEVKFGRKSTKRQSVPEEITFFLLHLSLMREYLELEFAPLRDKLVGFEYDFEKIIDDWVLMGFLVGNDFIPHLPNLHIANGALPILYKAYMQILPTLDGYLNEGGTLNLKRFEKFMNKLGDIDLENFDEIRDDLQYMEAKTGRKWQGHSKVSSGKDLEEWVPEEGSSDVALESLEPEKQTRDSGLAALIKETDEMCFDSSEETSDPDEDDAFENYKKDYYKNKLEYAVVTPGVMKDQAEGYVRAIQWNLNYYYNGVCSWSWYYPHHYAPYISDVKGFSDLEIDFDLGKPFQPYEQLLAVLPAASKDLLPTVYHDLMINENSVIHKYYPEDFQTDLNGKRQEWEAVVLIPFMDENLLLEAMHPCNEKLTPEEKARNTHGPMLVYSYTSDDLGPYLAPEYFPKVNQSHAKLETLSMEDIRVAKEKLVKGAYPGVKMNVYYPGFPTMKHLKYKAALKKAKIKVFEQPSRSENMVITIIPDEKFTGDSIPVDLLGSCVFVGWPHLLEAKVVAISNSKRRYISLGGPTQYNTEDRKDGQAEFNAEASGILERYKNRLGIECGETNVLVHVQVMIGRKYVFSPNGRLTLEKQFSELTANYPLQTVVYNINTHNPHHSMFRDVLDVFPEGSVCFTLTNPYYGSQGIVLNSRDTIKNGRVKICISVFDEPDFTSARDLQAEIIRSYKTLYNAASQLGMSNFMFSRVTGSIFFSARNGEGGLKSVNAGLDLKFNKKNKETPGYTRKIGSTWYYTDKAVDLVREYTEHFPEMFDFLNRDDRFDDITAEQIFGEDCDEKTKKLQTWLRTLPTASIERQTCGSSVMDPEVIKAIEQIIDSYPKDLNAKKVTMQIRPSFLYKPEIQSGTLPPDPKVNVKIFDRMVNARHGFSVPFGLKGTIIGINESASGSDRDTMYDVLFDKSFKDGMTLNCSDGRGYRLPLTAFLNISYGKRLLEEKTGRPGDLIAKAEASPRRPQSSNHPNNYPNGKQGYSNQFMPSQVAQRQNQQYKKPVPQQQSFNQQNSAFASFNAQGQRRPYQDPVPFGSTPPMQNQAACQQNQGSAPYQQNQGSKPVYQKQQQSNGNDFNSSPSKMSFQKSDNNFMPNFADKQASAPRQQYNENVQKQPKPEHSYKSQQNIPAVNTDFLRSILKIGESSPNENKENNQRNDNKPSESAENRKSVSSEMSPNLSFEMFAQAAKAPASVRLLTYYQSNGLGLPRYQYFNTGNLIQSQITLGNGDLVMGKPGKTREEASENVAANVLEILIKKTNLDDDKTNPKPTEIFPVPPKTWVEPQKMPPQTSKQNDIPISIESTSSKTKTDAVLGNPFVPLQAIKRHIAKNIVNKEVCKVESSSSDVNVEEACSTSQTDSTKNDTQTVQNVSEEKSKEKPKKQRKPRIAANFVKKN